MANRPPDYCPYCGTELEAVEPPTAYHCEECEDYVFHNPIPQARVAVVDGDRCLFVEVPEGRERIWTTPGGSIEGVEDPPVAAARELEEETGLTADPDDLVFFDACSYTKWEDVYKTALLYAVERSKVEGPIALGEEHSDARFFTPEEFRTEGFELVEFDDQPDRYRDPAWWLKEGTAAVDARL